MRLDARALHSPAYAVKIAVDVESWQELSGTEIGLFAPLFHWRCGIAREHRLPPRRIRCMTDRRYQEIRKRLDIDNSHRVASDTTRFTGTAIALKINDDRAGFLS
jgi:hypothetical protein